ncbi:MAG: hypothetical protein DLM50_04335 [Candidatus Meridianibacter frigidus]|nr:MAG: hypothetical protein DLM50_04335 [Candidatus Eremiobacteraeota bacterium]
MKLLFEILISIFLHPVAMILMWIDLARRSDLDQTRKVIWFIVSVVWGFGPVLYLLVEGGTLW